MILQINEGTSTPPEVAIIGQGTTYCAVCASRSASQDAVEAEVSRRAGSHARWRAAGGPMLDGRPNPRCCPHDGRRRHWLVVRSES